MTGLQAWVWQRLSAMILVFIMISFAYQYDQYMPLTWINWKAWANTFVFQGMIVTGMSVMFFHAWLGMNIVISDYINQSIIRLFLKTLILATLMGSWISVILTLWRLS